MPRQKIEYTQYFEQVMRTMTARGLLVGSYDAAGKGNLMTIGWGALGALWGLPLWMVLVRPSRYTYRCIEHSGCFSVNVPTEAMAGACGICGSKSGRDMDKFAECKLTLEKATSVLAPTVKECPIVYECRVIHSNDILPSKLAEEVLRGAYVDGDYHRIYFGQVLHLTADPNAAQLLAR